jgi:hypothetical protein
MTTTDATNPTMQIPMRTTLPVCTSGKRGTNATARTRRPASMVFRAPMRSATLPPISAAPIASSCAHRNRTNVVLGASPPAEVM